MRLRVEHMAPLVQTDVTECKNSVAVLMRDFVIHHSGCCNHAELHLSKDYSDPTLNSQSDVFVRIQSFCIPLEIHKIPNHIYYTLTGSITVYQTDF